MQLTPEQLDRIATIVSNKHAYIDIRSYGDGRQSHDEEWLELVQDFADATAGVLGTAGLEAIVRDLAAVPDYNLDCGVCHTPHDDPSCPYRRATEWVDVTDGVIQDTVEIHPGLLPRDGD